VADGERGRPGRQSSLELGLPSTWEETGNPAYALVFLGPPTGPIPWWPEPEQLRYVAGRALRVKAGVEDCKTPRSKIQPVPKQAHWLP